MTQKQTVNGIVESVLYVEDLEHSAKFYQDLFGFEIEIRDDMICVLRVPNSQGLILFPKCIAQQPGRTTSPVGRIKGMIPPHGGSGRLHIAFSIAASELEFWEQQLADRGIPLDSKVSWQRGGWSLYFRDPDQHLLELITPGLWTFY
ncbi:glyoxalase [Komarekiella sp. 'clone 1']|uniref:Glyoxalase n=1 Tax=Komarekiella delphini-convector SJRDD-AB1 TaxID=2593771 RepID=A0AA40T3V3_9NOST|nr:VOC family protein [Komarekiella delphini-convector]MBD6620463.1 glyoxalase [Komarekiella delphini-convector SJRDD-AB1]